MSRFSKLWLIAALPLLLAESVSCGQDEAKGKNQYVAAGLSLFIPGGGKFYVGKPVEGALFLGSELALMIGASQLDTGEKEYPLPAIIAYEIHQYQIFSAYRDARLTKGNKGYATPIERASIRELALSPFRWKYLKRPRVFLAPLIGVGLAFAAKDSDKNAGDIERVRIAGNDFRRFTGSLAYESMALPFGFSAALGEECFFRGVIQQEMERAFGPTPGLITASLLFSAAHIGQETRYEGLEATYPALATLLGCYCGWIYQRNGYELGEGIAVHGLISTSYLLANYLLDPEHNFLGVEVEFSY